MCYLSCLYIKNWSTPTFSITIDCDDYVLMTKGKNLRRYNISLEVAFRILDRLNQYGSHKRTMLASYSGLNYDVGTKYFENMSLLDWVEIIKENECIFIKSTQEGTRIWKKISKQIYFQ